MILRGESHVIRDRIELMKLIKKPLTVKILEQLQYLYDMRERRLLNQSYGGIEMEGMEMGEVNDYLELMRLVKIWMSQPVRVNFGGITNGKNKSRNNANAGRSCRRSKRNLRT